MENFSENSVISHRSYLYKIKENKLSQHVRRIKYLEEQKARRHVSTDRKRNLCDLFIKQIEKSFNDEEMECESAQNERAFQFKLMITEWFMEIPDDLEENWFVKFAPKGFRVLLVARNHYTSIYNKNGRYLFNIKTNFPGGGGCNENGTTVLDCICNKQINTIFILDCLFWNTMSTLDADATFRFYWLTSKFQESPALNQCLKYKFILMENLPAERTLIQDKICDLLKVGDYDVVYDGLVFYHKESQYTFGYTPLATWLASYMLPEKLGIDIPNIYLLEKPKNYVNFEHFIQNESLFQKKKSRNRNKKDIEDMDL